MNAKCSCFDKFAVSFWFNSLACTSQMCEVATESSSTFFFEKRRKDFSIGSFLHSKWLLIDTQSVFAWFLSLPRFVWIVLFLGWQANK